MYSISLVLGQFMKNFIALPIIAYLLLALGCTVRADHTEIHPIELNKFDDRRENIKLAVDLLNYDPAYIIDKIPGYTTEMQGGIQLGYHIPTSVEANPTYRVTLNMGVPAVAQKANQLGPQFDEVINNLADTHIAKRKLYSELSPKAKSWLSGLFVNPPNFSYNKASDLLKSKISEQAFADNIKSIKSQTGATLETQFLWGAYYLNFKRLSDINELVALTYSQKFSKGVTTNSTVYLAKEKGRWAIISFEVR